VAQGKTPSVLFLCEELEKMGYNPHIISRGYGGTSNEIIKVNPNMSYTLVGDEALMMSNYFPTWVSKNKFQAFQQAKRDGADILVLDDALQSFNIHKDLSIYVYDSIQSFGNRLLVPSGPLRETVKTALNKSQIFFLINTNICEDLTQKNFKQVLNYKISISPEIRERKLIAFAGLGFNKKFFEQLQNENLNLVKLKDFPDHHQYTVDDMFMLLDEANKKDAFLITTEKDYTRIPSEFKSSVGIIHGKIISENQMQLANEIEKYI
jgi:tetraacyldisaccharide 4'-kinase